MDTRALLTTLVLVAALTGCGGESNDSDDSKSTQPSSEQQSSKESAAESAAEPASEGEPQTEAAVRALTTEISKRHAAGDFAGEWQLFTTQAQQVIQEAAFVTYSEACAGTGLVPDIEAVRMDSDDAATVRLSIFDMPVSYQAQYENGAWRWVPRKETLERFNGTDGQGAIEEAKAAGSC